jgi:hypothetical protein
MELSALRHRHARFDWSHDHLGWTVWGCFSFDCKSDLYVLDGNLTGQKYRDNCGVHAHWPVSQRMIVRMGDYAWSEHIVTVFLACEIAIKNVQVRLTVKGKTTPDSPPQMIM